MNAESRTAGDKLQSRSTSGNARNRHKGNNKKMSNRSVKRIRWSNDCQVTNYFGKPVIVKAEGIFLTPRTNWPILTVKGYFRVISASSSKAVVVY